MLISNSVLLVFAIIGCISIGYWGTQLARYASNQKSALQVENEMFRDQVSILTEDLKEARADLDRIRDTSSDTQSQMLKKLLEM